MSRSVYDACGGCRNGQHSRCYAPCDCADGGHVMVGDREPVAPSLSVSTLAGMRDAFTFLVHLNRLLVRASASLWVGANEREFRVVIESYTAGATRPMRCVYPLDENDLKMAPQDLAIVVHARDVDYWRDRGQRELESI